MADEQSLLPGLWALDERTLALVYDQFQPKLYRYAYHLLGDVESAQDVVAETFLRLLQSLRRNYGPRQHLQAWLYRVTYNLIAERYRRRPAQVPLSLDKVAGLGHNGPQETERYLEQEQLRWALRRLTPDQRQVIVLKFLEGFGNQEVSAILNKPVGAVKSLQHRALVSLRRILETALPAQAEECS